MLAGASAKGIFGALTVKCEVWRQAEDKERANEDKNALRIIIYCLKILVKWTYEQLDTPFIHVKHKF
jgi:hypothetical protein